MRHLKTEFDWLWGCEGLRLAERQDALSSDRALGRGATDAGPTEATGYPPARLRGNGNSHKFALGLNVENFSVNFGVKQRSRYIGN